MRLFHLQKLKSRLFVCLPAFFAVLILPTSVQLFADTNSVASEVEINHFFTYLNESGCEFYRNGTWYKANQASDHLRQKYEYLKSRGRVTSAEDFIRNAATQSSMSGEAYQVRCPNKAPVRSEKWFNTELRVFRESKK